MHGIKFQLNFIPIALVELNQSRLVNFDAPSRITIEIERSIYEIWHSSLPHLSFFNWST